MSTAFTNLSTAQVDDMVVEAAREFLPLFRMFSIELSADSKVYNNVVKVQLSTDPTVGVKTLGAVGADTGALTGVDVTINTPKQATWKATEGTISAATLPAWWQTQINGGMYGCAKAIIDSALGLVKASAFGNTDADKLVVAPADFGWSDYAALEVKADVKIKRPVGMLLNAYYAGAIRAETSIMQYAATLGQDALASGKVPTVNGITPIKYVGLPDNGENLGGFVFGRAAIAGIVAPYDLINSSGEGDIVERRMITEPDSGLTVVYTVTAQGAGTRIGEIAVMYGVAVGRASDVVRLVTA
jgi:hypothetical protein